MPRTKSPPNENIIVTTVRLPRDVKTWLRERAEHFGGSPNAELVRLCRSVMDAEEAAKARKSAAVQE